MHPASAGKPSDSFPYFTLEEKSSTIEGLTLHD